MSAAPSFPITVVDSCAPAKCALPALLSQGGYDVRAGPSELPAEASTEPLHLLSRARSGFPTLLSLAIPTYQIWLSPSLSHRSWYFSHPLINVRGRLRPTSSNFPQPPL